ncbi:MAG: tetratricopeptide repeat protein [Flavobacteriales bacterium]
MLKPYILLFLAATLLPVVSSAQSDRVADSVRVASLMDSAFTYRATNLPKALEFLEIALEVSEDAGLEEFVGMANNRLGLMYNLLGRYDQSVQHLNEARAYFESIHDSVAYAMVTSNLALTYFNLGELDKSLVLNREAIAIRLKYDVKGGIATGYNNMANIFVLKGDSLELAADYYLKAHEILLEVVNKADAGVALKNLGDIAIQLGDSTGATQYYFEGLKLVEESGVTLYMPQFMVSLANIHLDKGEFTEALEVLEIGLDYAMENKQYRETMELYRVLSEIQEEQGNYKEALAAERAHMAWSDSVFSIDKINTIASLENTALLQKKELELRQQQESSQLQRRLNIYITSALIFALGLLVTVFLASRRFAQTNVILAKQKLELQSKTKRLEEMDADKNRLFGVISHDLRGPVANLGGMLELLGQEDLSQEEFTELSKTLHIHFGHLSSSLDNLLSWSALRIRGAALDTANFKLKEACDEVIDLLSIPARTKNIEVSNEIDASQSVFGDVEQVKIVLRNLVSNAIKFTAPGGKVSISAVAGNDKSVQISIKDSGVGIPTELQERLMKSGEEVTTYGTKGEKGTGLGLGLCRDYIEMNHGKFWFSSRQGQGSTFNFSLPSVNPRNH